MNQQIAKVLERIEYEESENVMLSHVRYWSIPRSTGEFLRYMVSLTRAKTILEIGCSVAYSTLWMADAAIEQGAHIYTTERFKPKIAVARNNIAEAGMQDTITLYENDAMELLANWNGGEIDFVFIDAEKKSYHLYYEQIIPLMRSGGLLIADNVNDFADRMQPFLDAVNNDTRVRVYKHNFDNGLMMVIKR